MTRNFKEFVIFLDICFKNNVVEIVFSHSHYVYCKPLGLITSYHRLDAVVRGMFHLPPRLNSPTRTPTQFAVYCVFQIHQSDVQYPISSVDYEEQYKYYVRIVVKTNSFYYM